MAKVLQADDDNRSGAPAEAGAARGVPRDPGGPGGRRLAAGAVAFALTTLALLSGPRARFEGAWVEPDPGPDVEAYLAAREAKVPGVKPGEEKGVVWAAPGVRTRTPVSIVYLHGFSADRHEVEPLVSDLAHELGANAFFTRLAGHGRDGAAMGEARVADWLADASEAVAIGGRLGARVVLVGTSTGGTLGLWAAAQPEAAGRIAALVLISPNLGVRDPFAGILTWPWGGLVARTMIGRERCFEPETPEQALHWTVCYPTSALLPMMALVEHVRGLDLGRVRVPTLLVYSPDDAVVDPAESTRLLPAIGGGLSVQEVTQTGDPAAHVIAGSIMSPGTTDAVRARIVEFLRDAGVVTER